MSALLTPFVPYILGALALLAGLWGYGKTKELRGRKAGHDELAQEIKDADQKRAREIRDRVDAARRGGGLHEDDTRGYRD